MPNNNVVKAMIDMTIEKSMQKIANTNQGSIDRIEAENTVEQLNKLRQHDESLSLITEYLMNFSTVEDAFNKSNLMDFNRRHPDVLAALDKSIYSYTQ